MAANEVKFKTGNICRIYMKDFLTFDEVEVRPKPKLNFICGPNGSGKSTILCAICICLGGKASLTGRGKEVYDYIKNRRTEAVLEVEVHVQNSTNVVITRKISNQPRRSCWFLQGEERDSKTVMQKIKELNICVDNLCQFLPQDRVAAFAKMNNSELLVATEKSVGDASLHQQHQLLCSSGERLCHLQENSKDLQERLATAERKNARLKDVVENLEVKVKLEEELKNLQTQRAWYLYDKKRKIHLQFKEELERKERELRELQVSIEPEVTRVAKKRAELHQFKKTLKEKMDWVKKNQQKETGWFSEYEKQVDLLKEAKRTYQARQQMEKQRQNEALDYRRQLDVLLGQLQNLPNLDEEETARRLKELASKIQDSSQSLVDLQGRLSDMCASKEKKAHTIKTHMKELASKQDVRGQRMELLRERNHDVYRATQWLQKNRDMFKGCIYPPICSVLNVRSQKYVSYVENRVSIRDLVAFVCEDKDDVNHLKEEMDRQRLRVNIIYSNPKELDRYKPPQPISSLRKFGFDTYMLDCVEGPPAILSYLCRSYNFHAIPIALSSNVNYNTVPASVTVFYIGNNRYSRAYSRYDREVSTNIYPLRAPRLLHIILDTQLINLLEEKIAQLQTEVKGEEETIRGIKTEEEELSKSLESWRNEKRVLASRKEERKVLVQRVNIKRNQLAQHEEKAIDLEAEKCKMEETVNACISVQVSCCVQLKDTVTNLTRGLNEGLKVEGQIKVLVEEVMALDQSLAEQQLYIEELKKSNRAITQKVEELKVEGHNTLNELKNLLGVTRVRDITVEIRDRFQDSSLEETEKLLMEKDAHLTCLVTATSAELQEYQQRQKEVLKLKKELEEVEHKERSHGRDLDVVKKRWLPHMTQLVADISDKFSQFMAQMGCAGEVVLKEAGDDFTRYGMAIRVRFHDHQKLQELTAHHQSGGERAVSTALYLLSLQSLTSAPFRCVDEINQGMDPINERQMMQMLMETEQSDDCSQCFFVTPKILHDLNFTGQQVNVMVVFNSPTTQAHHFFTVRKAIKHKRESLQRRRR